MSEKYREYFRENIPSFFHKGNDLKLYTIKGNLICDGYERIVIGDYGAFVEFRPDQASDNITCISELTGRYTILDGSEIKIRLQKETVPYADYKPSMFYVSVHEAYEKR